MGLTTLPADPIRAADLGRRGTDPLRPWAIETAQQWAIKAGFQVLRVDYSGVSIARAVRSRIRFLLQKFIIRGFASGLRG